MFCVTVLIFVFWEVVYCCFTYDGALLAFLVRGSVVLRAGGLVVFFGAVCSRHFLHFARSASAVLWIGELNSVINCYC